MQGVGSSKFPQACGNGFSTDVGESKAVDQSLLGGVTKNTGGGISGLRVEGDGAKLGKSKPQISPSEGSLRIFIESRGDA